MSLCYTWYKSLHSCVVCIEQRKRLAISSETHSGVVPCRATTITQGFLACLQGLERQSH